MPTPGAAMNASLCGPGVLVYVGAAVLTLTRTIEVHRCERNKPQHFGAIRSVSRRASTSVGMV